MVGREGASAASQEAMKEKKTLDGYEQVSFDTAEDDHEPCDDGRLTRSSASCTECGSPDVSLIDEEWYHCHQCDMQCEHGKFREA